MSFEERLIEEVRQTRIIFDKKHKFYKNIDMKIKAWDEIARKLDVKAKKAQSRWKSLRDRHTRSKGDCLPSGSGAKGEILPKKINLKTVYHFWTTFPTQIKAQVETTALIPTMTFSMICRKTISTNSSKLTMVKKTKRQT